MCTALGIKTKDFYFGRTFDWHCSYGEKVIVTPRNFPFSYRHMPNEKQGFAIIGTAINGGNYPLYYDAVNEKGLCMAGLNFPNNACYQNLEKGKINVASFEIIPYVLRNCEHISQAKSLLEKINITDDKFSKDMPESSLHWIIADKNGSLTAEATETGFKIYENPVNVLTNNPPFELQMENLKKYDFLSSFENKSSKIYNSKEYFCTGTGGEGLPGDNTSMSRFVRTVFNSQNAEKPETDEESLAMFFKIMSKVECIKGCVRSDQGNDYTVYISCCNADKGVYYVKTYNKHGINRFNIHTENLESNTLKTYDL